MPFADVADHKLYYELHEAEAPDPALPPLVLVT